MTGTYIEMVVYSFAGKKQIMGGEINFGKKKYLLWVYLYWHISTSKEIRHKYYLNNEVLVKQPKWTGYFYFIFEKLLFSQQWLWVAVKVHEGYI